MAITVALVDATPYRLRYLATQDGVISSPPVAADGLVTILNDGGATPDLRTDATVNAGPSGPALRKLLRVRLDGYGPVAAGAINQAQARALMNSDDAAGAVLINHNVGRAVTAITPRTGVIAWATDWNVDAQGDPVCEVRSATGTVATAYVDIHYRHTYDL